MLGILGEIRAGCLSTFSALPVRSVLYICCDHGQCCVVANLTKGRRSSQQSTDALVSSRLYCDEGQVTQPDSIRSPKDLKYSELLVLKNDGFSERSP